MRANEIMVGTNEVIVNTYLNKIHSDLGLIFDCAGVFIMDASKILEFVPYTNILNVINLSSEKYISLYVTYKHY